MSVLASHVGFHAMLMHFHNEQVLYLVNGTGCKRHNALLYDRQWGLYLVAAVKKLQSGILLSTNVVGAVHISQRTTMSDKI